MKYNYKVTIDFLDETLQKSFQVRDYGMYAGVIELIYEGFLEFYPLSRIRRIWIEDYNYSEDSKKEDTCCSYSIKYECAEAGCKRGRATGHALYRTSPKGEMFVGKCREHFDGLPDPVAQIIENDNLRDES